MAPKGTNPLLLYIGLACIAVALAGVGLSQLSGSTAAPPPATARREPRPAVKKPAAAQPPRAAAQAAKPATPDSARPAAQVAKPAAPDSARAKPAVPSSAEATRLLLAQIEQTPGTLDAEWLAGLLQHVRDGAGLLAYLEELRLVGAQRDSLLAAEKGKDPKDPLASSNDPRYLIEEARKKLHSSRKSAMAYGKARDYLAIALHRQHQRLKGDWKKMDALFMLSLLRENVAAHPFAGPPGDAQVAGAWMSAGLKAREALVVDRYLRVQEHLDKSREQFKNSQSSAGAAMARSELLIKGLNEALLGLGKFYAEAAGAETEDEARHQDYRDRAFRTLAMVYRRTQSGEALRALRQLDTLQKAGLLQAARATWEQARQAAQANRRETADEYYFQALQQYLQCATKLEGEERAAAAGELGRLRQEIAARQAQKQPPPALGQQR